MVSVPAPTGGWNARDALPVMAPVDAVRLENWFPDTDSIRLRRGYTAFCTSGMGSGPVETLIEYVGANARFLAAANANIYNITGGTASSLASGLSNNRWQWVNYSTTSGRYVVMVNGADTPRTYDGTSVATTSITNDAGSPALTSSNLVHVEVFQQALYFAESNKLGFWYLPVLAIAGAAKWFDLGPYCRRGGFTQAISTWTRDNGAGGMDDMLVVITSEGEVVVFNGTDPSDATKWAMQGVFTIGRPIGRRCALKIGAEIVVVCEDGFVPLTTMLAVDQSQADKLAISSKIGSAVRDAARTYNSLFGWQPVNYPRSVMAVFNIPLSTSTAEQYVANTLTGAWARFTGMNAACWGIYQGDLYFGAQTGGSVFKADTGTSDNGASINAALQTAFVMPNPAGLQKRFSMCRPIFLTDGTIRPTLDVAVDYDTNFQLGAPSTSVSTGALWGGSTWGSFVWGSSAQMQKLWQNVTGLGFTVSARMNVSTATATIRLQGFDLLYEAGGVL